MVRLPQEICDAIVNAVADNELTSNATGIPSLARDTLRACALVCTLWTPTAQKVLFRTLAIRFALHNKSVAHPFGLKVLFFVDPACLPFYDGVRKRSHLLSYVQTLRLKFSPGLLRPLSLSVSRRIRYWNNEQRLRYVLDVIRSLPAVEQLEVDSGQLAPLTLIPLLPKDVHSALLSILHLPSLSSFGMSDGVVADLFAMLRECPQIRRLVLGWIDGADVTVLAPPELDSLEELLCNDRQFLRQFQIDFPSQQMIKYGSLRRLHFGNASATRQGPHEESQWIEDVLRRLDGHLEHLSLCLYPIEPLWRLFDLSSLVYVELTTYWYDESWTWWIDWLIQSFSVPPASIKIQELKLSSTQSGSVAVNRLQPLLPQWNVFDKSLASWPELRRLILKLWPPCPQHAVIEAFPELERNSKLILVDYLR